MVLPSLLSGCISLIPEGLPPARIMTLSIDTTNMAKLKQVKWQMVVENPTAPSSLNSNRIIYQKLNSPIQSYYENLIWQDRLPNVLQNKIIAAFDEAAITTGVARPAMGLKADYMMQIAVDDFQIEYIGKHSPQTHIRLSIKMIRMPSRTIKRYKVFDNKVTATDDNINAIAKAFNQNLSQIINELAVWVIHKN